MGGGVMRAAAKVTGAGIVSGGGLRGVSLPVEHQVFSAPRKSYAPISSVVQSCEGSSVTESVQRPSWELDDWEFAGVEEDLSVESGELLPRVVFGRAPTKEEAEVATLELKDALEKVYFGSPDSAEVDGISVLSHAGHSGSREVASRSVPKPALQAFKFLSSTSEVQNVVASIVSDQNVWGAVFQNKAFVEYLDSQRGSIVTSNEESDVDRSVVDDGNQYKGDFKCSETSPDSQQSTESGSFFTGFIDSVKISVIDLANSVSDFFQNIFGDGETEKKSADAGDPEVVDMTTVGSCIIGLAVMVITVVVLKRV
ncbi:unnamed protein product [Rhodiola kirilowii]